MDLSIVFGSIVMATIFVLVMSLVPEPWRQRICAVLLASGSALYLDGRLGFFDSVFWLVLMGFAVWGLRWYPAIGIGWIIHTVWDLLSHQAGQALMSGNLTINLYCAFFDPLIALWFFAKAPAIPQLLGKLVKAKQP